MFVNIRCHRPEISSRILFRIWVTIFKWRFWKSPEQYNTHIQARGVVGNVSFPIVKTKEKNILIHPVVVIILYTWSFSRRIDNLTDECHAIKFIYIYIHIWFFFGLYHYELRLCITYICTITLFACFRAWWKRVVATPKRRGKRTRSYNNNE